MDTKHDMTKELASLAGEKTVVGAKQLKKALFCGTARRVFLAEDADPQITEPLARLCAEKGVTCVWVPSKTALGRMCGIEVSAAAAAAVQSD